MARGATKCRSCGMRLRPGARFCDQCGAREPFAAETEKRQATVLMCDLVGSTLLATSLPPEDLRLVFRAFRDAATPVIDRLDGVIVRYAGDGIQALFGLPAHEDSGERAVRAALEIMDAVHVVRPLPNVSLEVRIGIATGICIVGDVIGEGASREETVTGEAPHLAARLESMVAPGTALISEATYRLVSAFFECVALEASTVKGFKEPITAWRVVRERPVLSRFDAKHAVTELSPLIGRDEELASLLDLWRAVCTGTGRSCIIEGEAGIGKSRLCQALRLRIESDNATVLQYFCAPRFENMAFYPVIAQIEFAAGITRDDPPAIKLDKLEALLKLSSESDEFGSTVTYIANLLSIPLVGRYAVTSETPERTRERIIATLKAQVAALARRGPMLLVCEDLHWADPSTRDLIEALVPDIELMPVFLVVTTRPSSSKSAALAHPNTSTLHLPNLGNQSSSSIVSHVTGGKRLPAVVLKQILEKSKGVPLVLEELTKSVLDSELMEESADEYRLVGPLRSLAVPDTLQASLLARLDRLSAPVEEVAQISAAIGPEFSYDLLAAVHPRPGRGLQAALVRLMEADVIQRHGHASKATYSFKHALIQDAAHNTTLSDVRARRHARIAEVLERPPFVKAAEPELLAHHWTEAAAVEKAVPYWQQAGVRAGSRAAHAEAIQHFVMGLRLLTSFPPGPACDRYEVALQVQLGLSLSASRGYAAPEVEAAYARARELCHQLGDTSELFPVIRGLCTFYIVRSDLRTARELAEQCVRLGEETGHPVHLVEGYTALGYILVYMGQLESGQALLDKGIAVYTEADGIKLTFPSAQDPALACLCLGAVAAWMRGDSAGAQRRTDEASAHAAKLGRLFDLAYAHAFVAYIENLRGRHAAALEHAHACIQTSQQHGFGVWLGQGTMQLAIAQCAAGNAEQGVAMLTAVLDAWKASGAELSRPFGLLGLARGYAAKKEIERALEVLAEAIAHAQHYQERYVDAELFRVQGECLDAQASPDLAGSEASLRRAIDIAREQGAKLFQLRAALSLHKIHLKREQGDSSRQALADAIGQMEAGGCDIAELAEAKSLLASRPRSSTTTREAELAPIRAS